MKTEIEKAIKNLAEKIEAKDVKPLDAQQYSQAALNLSNILIGIKVNS